jgi:hypothetical protein
LHVESTEDVALSATIAFQRWDFYHQGVVGAVDMKIVLATGKALLTLEIMLVLYWLGSGVVVCVDGVRGDESMTKYISMHVLAALHFSTTITLCLALEYYHELEAAISGKDEELGNRGQYKHKPVVVSSLFSAKPTYLLSWAIAIVIALGTDAFITTELLAHWKSVRPHIIETICAIWGLCDTIAAIAWSIWLYVHAEVWIRRTLATNSGGVKPDVSAQAGQMCFFSETPGVPGFTKDPYLSRQRHRFWGERMSGVDVRLQQIHR